MDAAPEPGADDLVPELCRGVEVVHGVEVPRCPRGVEAADVQIDAVSAQELGEDLRHRGGVRTVGCRILGMVGRRHERPPTRLLGGRRVPVVEPWHRSEAVCRHRCRVDRGHGAPEEEPVLRIQRRHQCVGAHGVDHDQQPRRIDQAKCAGGGEVTGGPVELPDDVRRVEPCDGSLLGGPKGTRRPTIRLDLVECRTHSLLESGGGGSGRNCPGLFSRNGCTEPEPGRLRDCERWSETPDAGPGSFVSNADVVPTGVLRPSPVRRAMMLFAAANPTARSLSRVGGASVQVGGESASA